MNGWKDSCSVKANNAKPITNQTIYEILWCITLYHTRCVFFSGHGYFQKTLKIRVATKRKRPTGVLSTGEAFSFFIVKANSAIHLPLRLCWFVWQNDFFLLMQSVLSLDASWTVSSCKLLYFLHGNHIEVSFDGMLQTGCCNCKFNRALGIVTI